MQLFISPNNHNRFLALLGQDFTNTYLSQSISIYDWIIFASVPTGVPFAVKTIIRVSKENKFLRGLAVFPEEEEKIIERDLLSSTSDEVCEVWNGKGATRKIAPLSELPVTEWIFDGTLIPSRESKHHTLILKGTPCLVNRRIPRLIRRRDKGYCCTPFSNQRGK